MEKEMGRSSRFGGARCSERDGWVAEDVSRCRPRAAAEGLGGKDWKAQAAGPGLI